MKRPFSKGIRHLALKVNNLQEMQKFYVDVLGFEIEWQPDPQNLYITSGSDNLALHEVAEVVAPGALDHLGILVENPDDVDAWAEYLKSQGVKLKTEPRTHRDGARSIYFNDPGGNTIQLIYHPPISSK
jgi:catechol 2,3-dioxygenase-like lactoylglutathione lyase family enzyme